MKMFFKECKEKQYTQNGHGVGENGRREEEN